VGDEPGNGNGLARRRVLALLALTLPAACATAPPTELASAARVPEVTPSSGPTPLAAAPSASAPPLPPSAAPTSAAPKPSTEQTTEAAKSSPRGGPVPFKSGKAMLGSYLALGGQSLSESLALRRRQLGRDQRIVHRFYPWDGYVPTSEPDVDRDSVLMVSWHGSAWGPINEGSADRNIASVAKKLAGMKRPILLRWAWEMNGNWFEWDGTHNGQDPGDYVKAWRRIHRIFDDNGADNVAWVWSPNWNSQPGSSWNKVHNYYPGDAYVDWVGISGYNFYNETPTTLFNSVARSYGARKPLILSETAAVQNKAKWIKQLSSWVKATPAVGAVVWFDTDIQEGVPHNFRPDTDGDALAAYKAMANSARFSG
jgi:hypothetical protein